MNGSMTAIHWWIHLGILQLPNWIIRSINHSPRCYLMLLLAISLQVALFKTPIRTLRRTFLHMMNKSNWNRQKLESLEIEVSRMDTKLLPKSLRSDQSRKTMQSSLLKKIWILRRLRSWLRSYRTLNLPIYWPLRLIPLITDMGLVEMKVMAKDSWK